MPRQLSELQERVRANALSTLGFIASSDRHFRLAREAPYVDVPAEVFCSWADDVYYARDSADFQNAFSAQELTAMEAFDRVLNEVADEIAHKRFTIEQFVVMPQWERLAHAAREALRSFDAANTHSGSENDSAEGA